MFNAYNQNTPHCSQSLITSYVLIAFYEIVANGKLIDNGFQSNWRANSFPHQYKCILLQDTIQLLEEVLGEKLQRHCHDSPNPTSRPDHKPD